MGIKFTNNAFSTLDGSITDVATTINLAAGTGALFPTLGAGDYFYATLYSGATREIVKVTARSTDTLTVVRGQEGTTNIAWASGSTIGHRVTAQTLTDVVATGSVGNIVTATTATTLTSTKTLLQITPTGYGVRVTLPDATTCTEGGPLHIIDNKGAYPVMVDNSAGTLLGFVYGGVVSHISLIDNSTAAGVWSGENFELVGASAQLLTTSLTALSTTSPGGRGSIALDSDREFLLGYRLSDGYVTGVVYRKSTNTFGSVAVIRAANVGSTSLMCGVLQTTNQVLVVSCTSGSTAFEAVVCSVDSGTDAITPGTAATATLSGNITTFADGCGLIQEGASFITAYTIATPAAQIREITVSGTTPAISAATVLDGTAGAIIVATGAGKVIAVSTATTHLYTKPYTIGGLAAGTGTDTNSGTMTLNKLFPLGAHWCALYNDGGTTVKGGIISLSGSATTITTATLFSAGTLQDAIIVDSSKVLVLNNQTTNNANILTDTAGTASAGTAITIGSQTARHCAYVNGTTVVVGNASSTYVASQIDCSGASPVLVKYINTAVSTTHNYLSASSNTVLSRSPEAIFGTNFYYPLANSTLPSIGIRSEVTYINGPNIGIVPRMSSLFSGATDNARWTNDANSQMITKVECVV